MRSMTTLAKGNSNEIKHYLPLLAGAPVIGPIIQLAIQPLLVVSKNH